MRKISVYTGDAKRVSRQVQTGKRAELVRHWPIQHGEGQEALMIGVGTNTEVDPIGWTGIAIE